MDQIAAGDGSTETLNHDADTLYRALAQDGDQVRLTVSRETAELARFQNDDGLLE